VSRIRSIKPEFWASEQVMSCTHSARLLFIGLWNFCDDCGHHPLALRQIKALVFPGDDCITGEQVQDMIDELSTNGLVTVYVVAGRKYLEITGWRHQKIDKPQKPKFPQPIAERSTNAPGTIATERNTEYRSDGNGVEPDQDKKKERVTPSQTSDSLDSKSTEADINPADHVTPAARKNAGSAIDVNYRPPAHLIDVCRRDGANEQVINCEIEKFVAHHQSRGTFSMNWSAAWTTWWWRWKDRPTKVAYGLAGSPPSEPAPQPTLADFDRAAALFAKSGSLWSRQLGPEPGMVGCRCPPDLLRKHGIEPKTAVKLSQS
jgi:hypothetical protein